MRSAPTSRAPRADRSDHGDVDDQRSRRSRDVAAGERHVRGVGQRQQAVEQAIDIADRGPIGEHEREEREAGRAAHRRNVAQVDGERLVADVGVRGEAAVEVHALDERVGREHLQRASIRHRDGRIVADRDNERGGWRRQAAPDALDETPLADAPRLAGKEGVLLITGRSQRPGSRG